MSDYTVLMQAAIELLVKDAPDPEGAARYARARILGALREMPPEFISAGFQPEYRWHVRPANQPDPLRGRPRAILAEGTDYDLRDEYDRRALAALGREPAAAGERDVSRSDQPALIDHAHCDCVARLRARSAILERLYATMADIYLRGDESQDAQNRVADAFLNASTQQLTWNSPDGPVTTALAPPAGSPEPGAPGEGE